MHNYVKFYQWLYTRFLFFQVHWDTKRKKSWVPLKLMVRVLFYQGLYIRFTFFSSRLRHKNKKKLGTFEVKGPSPLLPGIIHKIPIFFQVEWYTKRVKSWVPLKLMVRSLFYQGLYIRFPFFSSILRHKKSKKLGTFEVNGPSPLLPGIIHKIPIFFQIEWNKKE